MSPLSALPERMLNQLRSGAQGGFKWNTTMHSYIKIDVVFQQFSNFKITSCTPRH